MKIVENYDWFKIATINAKKNIIEKSKEQSIRLRCNKSIYE